MVSGCVDKAPFGKYGLVHAIQVRGPPGREACARGWRVSGQALRPTCLRVCLCRTHRLHPCTRVRTLSPFATPHPQPRPCPPPPPPPPLVPAFPQELYGPSVAGRLLNCFSRLFTAYLQWHGFTCGFDDLLLARRAEAQRAVRARAVLRACWARGRARALHAVCGCRPAGCAHACFSHRRTRIAARVHSLPHAPCPTRFSGAGEQGGGHRGQGLC